MSEEDALVLAVTVAPAGEHLRVPAGAHLVTIGATQALLTLSLDEQAILQRVAGPTRAEQVAWAAAVLRARLNREGLEEGRD